MPLSSSNSDSPRFDFERFAAPALVAAITLVVFWPCLKNGFVSVDDPVFINPPYQGVSLASLRWMFANSYYCNYTPLALLSLGLDFTLCGLNPLGYHLTNILLHAANAVLFYVLCLEFFSLRGSSASDRAAAAAAAMFFSLHPLRVQSVAWVSERRDVLCGFFFLAAIIAWLSSFRTAGNAQKGRTVALILFALALLSKPAAVPFPLVLVLLDFWPLRRLPASPKLWGSFPEVWREKIPFFLLSAAFSAITALSQYEGDAVVSITHAVPFQRANQIAVGLVFYLGKTLWPANLSFYEWQWAPLRVAAIIGAAATIILLAASVWSKKLRPVLLSALAYQTIMLVPILGFVTIGHEIAADRYSYLSGLSWAILVGFGLRELAKRKRFLPAMCACVLITPLAVATRAQMPVWKDSISLWKREVRLNPATVFGRMSLAGSLLLGHRTGEAILYLEEQVRLYPQDWRAREALKDLIARTKLTTQGHAKIYQQLGLKSVARGEFDKAAWYFEHGLRYDPNSKVLREELKMAREALKLQESSK